MSTTHDTPTGPSTAVAGGPGLSPVDGAPTVRVIQCAGCDAQSPLGPPLGEFAGWVLGHARLTGHREFQQVTTELLHMVDADAGPAGAGGPVSWSG
ncbi:hypothetical protein ABT354_24565 [Streptomyces sp. NPDC000594]|uniref:DUF7848 domain-containing protein n=1 Tax=Streptomyces sp. NPDC000594 TaxID=3154261 RepID=UPI003321B92A